MTGIALAVALSFLGALAYKAFTVWLGWKRPPVNPDLEAIFARLDVHEAAIADAQAHVSDARDRVGAIEIANGMRRGK